MVEAGICFQIWINFQATSLPGVVPSDALEYSPSRPQAFILPVKRELFSPSVFNDNLGQMLTGSDRL